MELLFLLLLIIIMALALGSGFPVAFALPGSAILSIIIAALCGYLFTGSVDAYFHTGSPSQWLSAGVTNLRGVYWEVERDTLIAIPLFIFMGIMLQRSKIAEDLLVTMAQLFGKVPGGLGISVVFVGALLAATTGIVGATVVAMGLISLPAMLRNNYSPSLATGTIAASGTLGQIIPPSIVLIILADQLASATDQAGSIRKGLYKASTGELSMPSVFDVTSTSAGEMFLGAFVPGLLLVALYMIFILLLATMSPKTAPPVPYEGKMDKSFWVKVIITLFPPLTLIILVLGSIIGGIATVNQAGAIGAAGAIVMAGYRQSNINPKHAFYPAIMMFLSLIVISVLLYNFDMNIKSIKNVNEKIAIYIGLIATFTLIISLAWSGWRLLDVQKTLNGVMLETAKTTSLVFIILLGAALLTAAFRAFGGEDLVRDFLNSLPGGFWSKFIMVMLVIFVLGFFLDFIEIAVVVVPIVAPILLADPSANITAVWLGVMIGLNIQTSFLTPPFGFALFYLRGVAPAIVKTVQMYKGVIPFIMLQLFALGIVGYFPALVNYLPNRVSYLSDTAPPPKNPKIQYCLEKFVFNKLNIENNLTISTLKKSKNFNYSVLPNYLEKKVKQSFDKGFVAISLLKEIPDAEELLVKVSNEYRPKLIKVRRIELLNREVQTEIKLLKNQIEITDNEENVKKILLLKLETLKLNSKELTASIPKSWDKDYKNFSQLVKNEKVLRTKYRRLSDQFYSEMSDLHTILKGNDKFYNLENRVNNFRSLLETKYQDKKLILNEIKELGRQLSSVDDRGKMKSILKKIKRKIKKEKVKINLIMQDYNNFIKVYKSKAKWLKVADSELRSKIEIILENTSHTLGARSQKKLSRDTALFIAQCNSGHKDISLNF
ncbi:TRAP transporter large permease subunit [Alphaproteobacteria bacterium]|nr:TRAP transporter large permease subunit [Alphaproteobacteria bacterium]